MVVKNRNNPNAMIVPLAVQEDDEAELMELILAGAAKRPKSDDPLPKSFWSKPLPKASLDLSDLLREDRDAR